MDARSSVPAQREHAHRLMFACPEVERVKKDIWRRIGIVSNICSRKMYVLEPVEYDVGEKRNQELL